MKRCQFGGRCEFFGASEWDGNAMVKAVLCKDESCDENEGGNNNTKGASEQAKREHRRGSEQRPEARVDLMVKALLFRRESAILLKDILNSTTY